MTEWAGSPALRWLLAFVLMAHGVAHLVGFVIPWQLIKSADVPYRTTVLNGTFDLGAGGIRLIGIGWLALAASMIGLGLVLMVAGWLSLTTTVALVTMSLLLCAAGWPDTWMGLIVNAALLAVLVAAWQLDWFRGVVR
jgi:hypothetical protein